MEIVLLAVVAVVIGAAIYVYNKGKTFDVNNDGKVDAADAEAAVKLIKEDAKVVAVAASTAATKAKTTVKKAADKAKTTAKTTVKKATTGRGRKPKAK